MCQEGSFNAVSREFPSSLKEVSRVFQENFKGGLRLKIEGCFQVVFSGFQGYLKEV